eukprot:3914472-Rhodomonas_salina.1
MRGLVTDFGLDACPATRQCPNHSILAGGSWPTHSPLRACSRSDATDQMVRREIKHARTRSQPICARHVRSSLPARGKTHAAPAPNPGT